MSFSNIYHPCSYYSCMHTFCTTIPTSFHNFNCFLHLYYYNCFTCTEPLQVVWGDPSASNVTLKMPSEQSVADFHQLSACKPSEAGKYALRLLSLLFSNEELAVSNCTPAEGRKLLAKEKLLAIKCKSSLFITLH